MKFDSQDVTARFGALFQFQYRSAIIPMPAMALLLIGGVLLHQPAAAAIAAGAAYSVGFGATKRLWHSVAYMMVLTSVGVTIAAFMGTLAGRDPIVELVATAIMGGCCGALSRRSADLWWVWLQVVIAFLLAANFPGDITEGIDRAVLVATGAAIQCAAVWAMTRMVGEPPLIAAAAAEPATQVEILLYALRAAICISAALIASELSGFLHNYWAPMTAMLVLKPGLRDTGWRGLERIGGTIIGICLASGLVHVASSSRIMLAILGVLAAGAGFGLQRARYAALSAAITTSVLLMIALAGGAIHSADRERLLATLLGGAVALAGAAIAPRRQMSQRSIEDHL